MKSPRPFSKGSTLTSRTGHGRLLPLGKRELNAPDSKPKPDDPARPPLRVRNAIARQRFAQLTLWPLLRFRFVALSEMI